MLIAFFVNDMEREYPGYTTTVLAHRGGSARPPRLLRHAVAISCCSPDDSLRVHARFLPKKQI